MLPSLVLALALSSQLATRLLAQQTVTVAWNANPESDISGYNVHLGTVSGGAITQTQDVGNSVSAALSGLLPGMTYYCTVQAYNLSGLTSAYSSEISFTTHAPGVLFDTWAGVANLSGGAAQLEAMPFKDGVANLLKYAFNMNAAAADLRVLPEGVGTAGLPVFTLEPSGSQLVFKVEFLRRKGSGLVYLAQTSSDLVNFVPMGGTTSVQDLDASWDRVTIHNSYDAASTRKLFGKVEVTMP